MLMGAVLLRLGALAVHRGGVQEQDSEWETFDKMQIGCERAVW